MAATRTDTQARRLDVADLGDLARDPSIERALEAVRDLLGMQVAFISRIEGGDFAVEHVSSSGDAFAELKPGFVADYETTYCIRVLSGRLPNLIPDTAADDRALSPPVRETLGIGAYAGVPLRYSDGTLYGTLCAVDHEAVDGFGYQQLQFLHVVARLIADQLERAEQERRVHATELQAASAKALVAAVAARDSYTAEHSEAVVEHVRAVAERLGLSPREVAEVEYAALLHDIGKIAIPDAILRKPGRLDADEWEVMRHHPISSAEIIGAIPGLQHLAPVVRAEHERWDGGGYPDGLAGEQIPLASRITLVCDAYHAMTSDRPYRKAMPEAAARAEIEAGIGTQFCPAAARALLDVLGAAGQAGATS